MAPTPIRLAAASFAAALCAGGLAYMGSDDPPAQVQEVDLLLDGSASLSGDACAEAEEAARALVRGSAGHLLIHVYGLSGRSRDGQPVRLAKDIALAPAGSALHGAEERAADQAAVVEAIGRACREGPRLRESLLVPAVTALIGQIRGVGQVPGRSRVLLVLSDGLDESGEGSGAPLDNTGITTILCGTALRAPHRGTLPSPQAIAAAWQGRFLGPIAVLPSCHGIEPLLVAPVGRGS